MPDYKKKAVVEVLGCKVNQAEAAAMIGILQSQGYVVDPAAQEPDLVLVNTCCVTSKAEAKSRRMANRLVEKYPSALVVVTGCLAEVNPSSIQEDMDRVVVLGTFEKDRFAEFLEKSDVTVHRDQVTGRNHDGSGRVLRAGSSACTTFVDQGCAGIPGRGRTFLKVQDGCSQRCSYCIVPSSRGPSRSLVADAVCAHARTLAGQGFSEIVLTGIHLGWYGRDLTPAIGLQDLLERLLEECPTVRFRMSSVEPQEITPRLIELAATHPRVCRHFHIPLQSGDDEILSRMGRPYRTGFIRRLWEKILNAIPDVCVGLDIMVGFPGESEQSFLNTLSLVQELGGCVPARVSVLSSHRHSGRWFLAAGVRPDSPNEGRGVEKALRYHEGALLPTVPGPHLGCGLRKRLRILKLAWSRLGRTTISPSMCACRLNSWTGPASPSL